MPGFLDNWGRPAGSPPPFFSSFDTGMGGFDMGGMGGWGASSSVPAVVPPVQVPTLAATVPAPTTATGGVPSALPGSGGLRVSPKLGLNMDTANLALTGLSTIGNLWAAFQAQKLAKEQFSYTKNVTDTNLANQIKTYNTGLTDRANNRAVVEGRTPDQTKAYVDANSLRRYGA